MSSISGTKRPADTPFVHGPDCPFVKIAPAWSYIGERQWERACRCHTERVTVLDEAVDPASSAAEPSWRAALHRPDCDGSQFEQLVRIEKREGGTGWRATCLVCTQQTVFYWDPVRVDRKGRPVIREANCLYRYELKHQPVSV
jgi:hypothetical protein